MSEERAWIKGLGWESEEWRLGMIQTGDLGRYGGYGLICKRECSQGRDGS